mmetsp:Transcript_42105/g.100641  ORF Transcript_42105/g.100641 Transcript_42105/m.100641 type:complete len:142 (-) Transcript_42105:20-445(-)
MVSVGRGIWATVGFLAANLLPLLTQLPAGRSMWCWAADGNGNAVPNQGSSQQDATASYYHLSPCSTSSCSSPTHFCHVGGQCDGTQTPSGDDALANVQGRATNCAASASPASSASSANGVQLAGTGGLVALVLAGVAGGVA